MTLTLEREWSLIDLRKEQRRVSALMLTDSSADLQKHPLRRRLLPRAFCYVCSRVDPSGIFRNPNSYLFRKGFLQSCEHFPKAPYTTFVADELKEQHSDESRTGKTTESSPFVAPSITVTIKQSSGMVSQHDSPLRREKTFGSSVDKLNASKVSRSLDESLIRRQKEADKNTLLPPIPANHRASLKVRNISNVSSKSDKLTDIAIQRVGQENSQLSGIINSETDKQDESSSVTVIPYGQGDDTWSDSQSKITELSIFTKGTTPTKTTNDLDSKPITTYMTSTHTARTDPSTDLEEVLQTKPYINDSDGLDFGLDPFVRDTASLESYSTKTTHRPKASRPRDKGNMRLDESVSSARPESGHLRYHHRIDEDSVPDPGFEIPPTPSEDELQSLANSERMRLEEERQLVEQQIAEGKVFAESSAGFAESSVSDDASLGFSEVTSRTKVVSEMPTLSGRSGKRSFCRCTTGMRDEMASENVCRTCGKPLLHHGSSVCSAGSSETRPGNYGGMAKYSVPPTSQGSVSTKSRQNMLNDTKSRQNMLNDTKSRQNMLYDSKRIRTATDEDYMDLDSIIHEDDGHYFSSDEENFHFDNSPETFERYRQNRSKPRADPDLHKIVYLRALREAQLRKFEQEVDGLYENEEFPSRKHTQTFSYFHLLPQAESNVANKFGLKPPENAKIKKGQLMKHILGDVDMDAFYQLANRKKGASGSYNAQLAANKSVGSRTRRVLPEVPREKDVSSVSLKMSRNDIKVEDT